MKKYLCVVLSILLTVILLGCYGPHDPIKPYPWYRAECWYCAEIDMNICFSYDDHEKRLGMDTTQLSIGNNVLNVGIAFNDDAIGFLVDEDMDGVYSRVLDGIWIYRDRNMVVQINNESIFDGKYTELVFVPSE